MLDAEQTRLITLARDATRQTARPKGGRRQNSVARARQRPCTPIVYVPTAKRVTHTAIIRLPSRQYTAMRIIEHFRYENERDDAQRCRKMPPQSASIAGDALVTIATLRLPYTYTYFT